jgi:hypothetical protein
MNATISVRPLATAAALGLICLLAAASASAQVPTTMSYQGRLLENTSEQEPVDVAVDIVFSIWSGSETDPLAVQLWTESWTGVTLSNGIFSVLLGSNGSPLDPADFQGDTSLYLQLQVGGETLSPRQQLGAVPFALVDEPANEIQDLSLAGDTLALSGSPATVDLALATVIVDLLADLQALEAEVEALGDEVFFTRVFISSTAQTPDFGGVAAADAICQSLADAADLGGTWLAWLADGLGNSPATTFIQSTYPYKLLDGTVIAEDWDDLIDGDIDGFINIDENGDTTAAGQFAWTNVSPTTGAAHGIQHCSNWTSSTSPVGRVGDCCSDNGGVSPEWWTGRGAQGCGFSSRLYCFEQ